MLNYIFISLLTVYVAAAGVVDIEELNGVDERIFNGRNAVPGQFPYQTLLFMTNTDGKNIFCGGSLVSTQFVLTAAHCCFGVRSTRVYIGLTNTADYKQSWVQKMDVPNTSFIIHPQYNPKTITNDICLLKLPAAAQINANVSVITLPSSQSTNPSQYNWNSATISGWGQTNDFEGLHPRLQWSNVRIDFHFHCWFHFLIKFVQVSNNQICSSKIPWTGSCRGDSGSPLTVLDSSGKPVEIGLASWGFGSCDSFNPVVFTFVPAYYDWLKQNMV